LHYGEVFAEKSEIVGMDSHVESAQGNNAT
jgi:hypothetical protein